MNERCQLVITIGRQCTRFVRNNFPGENESYRPQFHLSLGVSQPMNPAPGFTSICYNYNSDADYASKILACRPGIQRIISPAIISPAVYDQWESTFYRQMHTLFEERGIEAKLILGKSSADLKDNLANFDLDYDALVVAEASGSIYIHRFCAYLARSKKTTFFSGNISDVQNQHASIGYGADFLPLAETAIEFILRFHQNAIDLTIPLESTWLNLSRRFAANLLIAEQQGLDPNVLQQVCTQQNGIIYPE